MLSVLVNMTLLVQWRVALAFYRRRVFSACGLYVFSGAALSGTINVQRSVFRVSYMADLSGKDTLHGAGDRQFAGQLLRMDDIPEQHVRGLAYGKLSGFAL